MGAALAYIGDCKGHHARHLADQLDRSEVTHAVICYRLETGDVRYRLVGEADRTYLIGMVERVQQHMIADADD